MYRFRANLDGDVTKTGVAIEHFLLPYALQSEPRSLKDTRRLNGGAVPHPARAVKAHQAIANRHIHTLSYSPFVRLPGSWMACSERLRHMSSSNGYMAAAVCRAESDSRRVVWRGIVFGAAKRNLAIAMLAAADCSSPLTRLPRNANAWCGSRSKAGAFGIPKCRGSCARRPVICLSRKRFGGWPIRTMR